MKSKLLYFFGGVVAGSAATFIVLRRRTERRIEQEVESVREAYKTRKMQQTASESLTEASESDISGADGIDTEKMAQIAREIAAENAKLKADLITSSIISEDNGYFKKSEEKPVAYNLFSKPPRPSDIDNGIDEDEDLDILNTTPPKDAPGPYVLEDDNLSKASEKFVNEEPNFDKITLFLYDDGVLCSEDDEIITNIAATIGHESLGRIGEYEPDVVYVRNESISTDYEVIRQYTNFASIPDDD